MTDDDMSQAFEGGPPEDRGMGGPPQSVDEVNEEEGDSTAVVSNKILSPEGEPLKKGDEIVVRVVENYGDESLIEYAPKKGGEDEEYQEPMSTEEQELTALSEEGEE